jgi:hypothetical protein
MKSNKSKKGLSTFEEDCIWMSYRYCIGRSTIAAHMHAGGIANFVYDKLTPERLEYMSEDICHEIYDKLKWNGLINMGWYGNIPKEYFKPIDVIYNILKNENIDSPEKFREIKNIRIEWDTQTNKYIHEIIWVNHETKFKDYGKLSLTTFHDLEIWQNLANLLDIRTHKFCRLVDDTIVEYYEYWRSYYNDGKLCFDKVKAPVECKNNLSVCCYIPEENIKEDNIEQI